MWVKQTKLKSLIIPRVHGQKMPDKCNIYRHYSMKLHGTFLGKGGGSFSIFAWWNHGAVLQRLPKSKCPLSNEWQNMGASLKSPPPPPLIFSDLSVNHNNIWAYVYNVSKASTSAFVSVYSGDVGLNSALSLCTAGMWASTRHCLLWCNSWQQQKYDFHNVNKYARQKID